MSLSLRACVEKTVHGLETYWLSVEKNVPGAVISKEGLAENLLRYERLFMLNFPEKAATRKIGFCCKLL